MDSQEIFKKLQPNCIEVAKEGSLANIRDLRSKLESFLLAESKISDGNASFINDLKEYLAFPLLLVLKKKPKCRESVLEEVISTIHLILLHSHCEDWIFFQEMFNQLFLMLTSQKPMEVADASEECKQLVCEAATALVKSASSNVLETMLAESFRAPFGHAIYLCLKLAQQEKNRKIILSSLGTIKALGLSHIWNEQTKSQQNLLSNCFGNFLPGIVIAMTQIAVANEIQGHKITVEAIQCWSYFVMIVMRDNYLEVYVPTLGLSLTERDLKSKLFPQTNLTTDKSNKDKVKKKKSIFDLPEPDNEVSGKVDNKLKSVKIEQVWVDDTSGKILVLVQSLVTLVPHSHWAVRLALAQWADCILKHSPRSLSNCVMCCIEASVTLASNVTEDVSEAGKVAVATAQNMFNKNTHESDELWDLLQERIFALATKLPTTARQQEDRNTLASIQQLAGCLEVLGQARVYRLIQRPSHICRLLRSLLMILTYDSSDLDLLMEKALMEEPFEIVAVKPYLGQTFRYFLPTSGVLAALTRVCYILGSSGNLSALCELCLDFIEESTAQQKEALLLLRLILAGYQKRQNNCEEDHKIEESIIGNILDLVNVMKLSDITTCLLSMDKDEDFQDGKTKSDTGVLVVSNRHGHSLSVELLRSNVIVVTNVLQLIAICSMIMKHDFEVYLSEVLCSVMEKAGDPNVLISYAANTCLKTIANSSGYKSIQDFIEGSVPHFWFTLSMRLRRLEDFPSSPNVLKVALLCEKEEVRSFTEELVDEVLTALDTHHNSTSHSLLNVLLVYVSTIAKSPPPCDNCVCCNVNNNKSNNTDSRDNISVMEKKKEKDNKIVDEDLNVPSSLGVLTDYIYEHHKAYNDSRLESNIIENYPHQQNIIENVNGAENFKEYVENKQDCDEPDNQDEEEKKQPVPRTIELIVSILERCSHLLYVRERKLQLIILNTIDNGCLALSHWENEALPVFHKLWKPLMLRLKDTDFVVMLKGLDVCVSLIKSRGDFLKRRTLTDVFPPLLLFLKNQSNCSVKKTITSGYFTTPAYKAQVSLLTQLPNLSISLKLDVVNVTNILEVITFYLDTRQPPELSTLAVVAVKQLSNTHPHHVWLCLSFCRSPSRLIPSSSKLCPIKLTTSRTKHILPTEAEELYHELC